MMLSETTYMFITWNELQHFNVHKTTNNLLLSITNKQSAYALYD